MDWGSRMAGEITQEAINLLTSAAIGAGGAVSAQVVGGIITSRREARKAAAEERRWQLESNAKRRDRGLDQKVALFSKFLATVEGIRQAEAWGKPISSRTFYEHDRTLYELNGTLEEIGLVAPDVYKHMKATHDAVGNMLWSKISQEYEQGDPAEVAAARRAEEALQFWMGLTRAALRSYINHEPVVWPEEAIYDFKAAQRREAKNS